MKTDAGGLEGSGLTAGAALRRRWRRGFHGTSHSVCFHRWHGTAVKVQSDVWGHDEVDDRDTWLTVRGRP